jgi:hypothetical protein
MLITEEILFDFRFLLSVGMTKLYIVNGNGGGR